MQSPQVAGVVADLSSVVSEVRTREGDVPPDVVVVPLLLSTGVHVGHDIAHAVADRDTIAAGPLGPDPRLAEVMAQRLAEAGGTSADAVVMAAAGNRDPAGQAIAREMGRLLAARLGREVGVGFISAATPSVAAAVDDRRAAGATRVAVAATYLLAPGQFHSQLEGSGADLVAAPLGDHPLIAEIAVDRYRTMLGA